MQSSPDRSGLPQVWRTVSTSTTWFTGPSHSLVGRHRIPPPVSDAVQTLTCDYGFRRTGRTPRSHLRIR